LSQVVAVGPVARDQPPQRAILADRVNQSGPAGNCFHTTRSNGWAGPLFLLPLDREEDRPTRREEKEKKRDEKSERKETEGKRRGARMRRGDRMDDDDRSHAQIPTSFGPELRACLRCRLVKTYDQVHAAAATSLHFLRLQFSVLLSI
jgi:hypothetical protein